MNSCILTGNNLLGRVEIFFKRVTLGIEYRVILNGITQKTSDNQNFEVITEQEARIRYNEWHDRFEFNAYGRDIEDILQKAWDMDAFYGTSDI